MRKVTKAAALEALAVEAGALPERYGGCAMCAVAAGHPPGTEVLAENDAAVAVLDRYAARPGHVLVVLRAHVEQVWDLPWEAYAAVQRLAWEAARAAARVAAPRRVFVAALGSPDPLLMSFPHHHVHVLPVAEGGPTARPAEVFTWSAGVYVYEPGEARALADALRAAWGA